MITVKCFYANGDTITTGINATIEGAREYFEGNVFNIGSGEDDNMQKCVRIEQVGVDDEIGTYKKINTRPDDVRLILNKDGSAIIADSLGRKKTFIEQVEEDEIFMGYIKKGFAYVTIINRAEDEVWIEIHTTRQADDHIIQYMGHFPPNEVWQKAGEIARWFSIPVDTV